MNRRDVLRSLAVGAGSVAFTGTARAAVDLPKRLVCVFIPNGLIGGADYFKAGPTPTDIGLGTMTEPLRPYLKDLVVADNLEFKGACGETHYGGQTQWLTGRVSPISCSKINKASGISIDQYLGQKVGRVTTPDFPALVTSVHTSGLTHSYTADGTPVPSNDNPFDVYNRLFANLMVRPANDRELAAYIARRKSVLDVAAKDLVELQRRLPAQDRARAEIQLDGIRTMEDRLASLLKNPTCQKPAAPTATFPHRDSTKFPELSQLALGNVVNAFACDRTRVAVLAFFARQYAGFKCLWAPINQPMDLHGLSHGLAGAAVFQQAKRFIFQLIADHLLAKLAAIPEGSGTMLDNTIVFIGTEIGLGHSNAGLTFFTVGGKNLGVQTGRWIRPTTSRSRDEGTSHTRLLVSLLQAMGLRSEQTFGDGPGTGSGPLPGYLA